MTSIKWSDPVLSISTSLGLILTLAAVSIVYVAVLMALTF